MDYVMTKFYLSALIEEYMTEDRKKSLTDEEKKYVIKGKEFNDISKAVEKMIKDKKYKWDFESEIYNSKYIKSRKDLKDDECSMIIEALQNRDDYSELPCPEYAQIFIKENFNKDFILNYD